MTKTNVTSGKSNLVGDKKDSSESLKINYGFPSVINNETERRSELRVPMHESIEFEQVGRKGLVVAMLVNLSSSGLLMRCAESFIPGTRIRLTQLSNNPIVPNSTVSATILRCEYRQDIHSYAIACIFDTVH